MARRLGIALLLLTNAVDLAVVSLTGSIAGACAIGVSVLTACVSIALGSHVPGRTRIMAALATPLNLQALIIADHDDPDELLLISAARSSVLAVVAAMPLLYPPRLGSDAAIADATLGACVLCLFLSLLGVVLPSLRDVREGTSANTLSANSLGGGGLGDNIMAHATQQEGHTPPSRPRRLGGDAFRLLDPEGALPPRSRRTYLPQAGLQHHGGLRTHLSNPTPNPNRKPKPSPNPHVTLTLTLALTLTQNRLATDAPRRLASRGLRVPLHRQPPGHAAAPRAVARPREPTAARRRAAQPPLPH